LRITGSLALKVIEVSVAMISTNFLDVTTGVISVTARHLFEVDDVKIVSQNTEKNDLFHYVMAK